MRKIFVETGKGCGFNANAFKDQSWQLGCAIPYTYSMCVGWKEALKVIRYNRDYYKRSGWSHYYKMQYAKEKDTAE